MKPNAINYLSLARKAGRIEVGEEPVGAAARSGHARLVLVASDAPDNTRRRAKNFVAGTDQQMVVLPFTKEEMGIALGRSVVALAAMTDPAMALAFLKSLGDDQRYAEAMSQLTIKAERVRRHQQELKAHEKNIRTGKVRKSQDAKPRQQESEAAPGEDRRKTGENRREAGEDRPAEPRRNDGYGQKRREGYSGGKGQTQVSPFHASGRNGRPQWIDKRPDPRTGDTRKTGKWNRRDTGKGERQSAGHKPQYRKDAGRPAGQKYATVNKAAGRKPGRKTHGGAEV